MAIRAKQLDVGLPFGIGSISFVADEVQQRAAWSLYVELETRVAVQPLDDDTGLLREALNSLYAIFEITRGILKEAGPEVADGEASLGPIAIRVLNDGLRPFLSDWHPRLKAHEAMRPNDVSELDHERAWDDYAAMRAALVQLQTDLRVYTDMLAEISGAKATGTANSA